MTRVLSALVLLPLLVGVVVLLPPWGTVGLGLLVVVLGSWELHAVADAGGAGVSAAVVAAAAAGACLAVALGGGAVEVALVSGLVVIGATSVGRLEPGEETVRRVAAALMAPLYVGVPIGTIVGIRASHGPEVLLLGLFTVMASDIAQYYGGRALGRRPLSPRISPKKTVEGAVAGVLAGALVLAGLGRWWLPQASAGTLVVLGALLALLGIVGDLFESLLKRSAGVKDSSGLIPGHGGVLDRVDSLLFAGPVYALFVRQL